MPSTLADCLATSCGLICNPAKNRGLPVDIVPQKVQKTTPAFGRACETSTMANERHATLWVTLLGSLVLFAAGSYGLTSWKSVVKLNPELCLGCKKFKELQIGLRPD